MKIRHIGTAEEKIELQMTPMIDIVFQLLVFFVMTFKVVVREGDFNIRMPAASAASSAVDDFNVPIKVKLEAGLGGTIADIIIDDQESLRDASVSTTQMFELLSLRVAEYKEETSVGDFASELEVEFDTDYDLRYEEQIKAITAVSGRYDAEGNLVKLADKIKFKDAVN